MNYYKTIDEYGEIKRIDACISNVSNGVEISKSEYNAILSEIKTNTEQPQEQGNSFKVIEITESEVNIK